MKEVWLVTPYPWMVEVFLLDGETYRLLRTYEREGVLVSEVFPELRLGLSDVFSYPIDPDERIDMVKEGRPPYPDRG